MSDSDLTGLVRRLELGGKLSAEDVAAIMALPFLVRSVPPATYLVREGEPLRVCAFLLNGFAFRYKIVGNGGRQIVSLHLPGEAIDLPNLYTLTADHNAQTLTHADLAMVPMPALRALIDSRPALARAILLDMLVEAAVLREWITSIGRRDARTRLAHLLCELCYRLDAQGLAGDAYELPLTQEQIGDVLGLTAVHVNRSIKRLEEDGLIVRKGRLLTFPDLAALREAGDFSARYLQVDHRPGPA